SRMDVHTLIPSRPDLRWFAHATPWFGPGNHIQIGVNCDSDAYVTAMINDMKNRGFNGVIINWYGKGDITDNVTLRVKKILAATPGNKFTYILMVDKGVRGGTSVSNLEAQIHYCQTNYFTDPNYEREPVSIGSPILMFFGVRSAAGSANMTTIKSDTEASGGNMVWVEQGTSYINESWEDETFQWTDDFNQATPPPSNNPFNLAAVISEYSTIKSHTKKAFAGMCSQFNGTLTKSVGWSLGKYLPGSNALCLVERAAEINTNLNPNFTRMQWATWSDWEEGTAIEAGIENNVSLNVQLDASGNLTGAAISGEPRAIDHYEIYASADKTIAALVATAPSGSSFSVNLNQLNLPTGTYYIYVDAVGIPCVRDHMSTNDIRFVAGPPPTLIPTDYSHSMKITFSGYNRSTALSNFPMLVNFSTNVPGFAYDQFTSPKANDLRFTDPAGIILNHEIDQWNTNGVSSVWVNVPLIASSTNYIMAYWGNPADSNAPPFTKNGSTWPGFSAVMHLKETGFPYADSTTLHSASSGLAPTVTSSGPIGNAETFNGTIQCLVPSGTIDLGNSFSLSAWVKLDATATNIQTIWANKAAGGSSNGVALFINSFNTADGMLRLETGDGTATLTAASVAGAVPVGGWHHVFVAANRATGTASLYVDGVDVTSSSGIRTDFAADAAFNIGRFTNAFWYLKGTLDEARIEPWRSADWVWATWMNVASNAALVSYSTVTATNPSTQQPLLQLKIGPDGPLLSWPGQNTSFTVYSTTSLAAPVQWTEVTDYTILPDGEIQLPSPQTGVSVFYRVGVP
ncbi:MAG TPA: DUF2341 domain-containing protein, partial [Candidatus Angelobacter sp.]|nr:DUF2341 domain-containing protein [Candidatus Angelobacter sp.]